MVIGHQRGRDAKENLHRNFGMPHPEGYRKALRLMQLAEKFHVPVITFIDTQGAWAGLGAEERGQSEAIARNLYEMSRLEVPDRRDGHRRGRIRRRARPGRRATGCSCSRTRCIPSSPSKAARSFCGRTARARRCAKRRRRRLHITAQDLLELRVVDEIVPEPPGGAQADHEVTAAKTLQQALVRNLDDLRHLKPDKLVRRRREKYFRMGQFSGNKRATRGRDGLR